MGINGLETLFNELYSKDDKCYKEIPLSKLRLVVDGGYLPKLVNTLIKHAEFGGSYDELYEIVKKLFKKLKPITEVVIFHGPKYCETTQQRSFKNKIYSVKSFFGKTCPPDNVRKFPPMFTKAIIFEVVKELDINYLIADKDFHQTIACYADGMNRNKEEFTILGYNSIYFAYNLSKGYLCWQHLEKILLKNIDIPLFRRVPVFYLSTFLSINRIKLKTWHYLCIVCGEIDKYLRVKHNFMKLNKLQKVSDLLEYLKDNELDLIRSNYKSIRDSFREGSIEEVDNRIKKYRFDFVEENYINDSISDNFTPIIQTIKNLKVMELKCYIEDMEEKSCFEPVVSSKILESVYKDISYKEPELDIKCIKEVVRKTSNETEIDEKTYDIENLSHSNVYTYLQNKSMNSNGSSTLFFTALSLWYFWLNNNYYTNNFDKNYQLFESIITNLLLINVCEMKTNIGFNNIVGEKLVNDLVSSYHQFRSSTKASPLTKESRQIIHRLNEFQAIYFSLGLLNKAAEFNFEFMSTSLFLNAHFIMTYVKKGVEWDILTNLIENSNVLSRIKHDLMNEFKVIYKDLYGEIPLTGDIRPVNSDNLFIFAKKGQNKMELFNEMAEKNYDIGPYQIISSNFDKKLRNFHSFPNYFKIYVSNVSRRLTNNDLERYFNNFGNVLGVKIIRYYRSSKNNAIVLFRDQATSYYLIKQYENNRLYADIDGQVYMLIIDPFVSRR